ncbi:MAG TPA: hypothetical protein VF438_01190 [Candidatus Paceibacterota bacterium]
MRFTIGVPGRYSVQVRVEKSLETRLATTCFRNSAHPLAGNFMTWRSCSDMFADREFCREFPIDIGLAIDAQEFGITGLCMEMSTMVGWSGSIPRSSIPRADLEKFNLNRVGTAFGLRLKSTCTDLRAPKTNLVTLVYRLTMGPADSYIVDIRTIYPGEDVGELRGDVTRREGRIFFDWSHPGEP